MNKNKIVQQSGSKNIISVENEEHLLVEYRDEYVDRSGGKKRKILKNALFLNNVTSSLMEYLEGFNVSTQYVRQISDTEMLIKNVTQLPFYIVVQNFASPALSERYGFCADGELENPVIEYYLDDPERNNPMLNETHIAAFGLLSCDDANMVKRLSSKINVVLKSYFLRRDLKLIQVKLAFGFFQNNLVLNTDFSFETLHLMNLESGKKYDERLYEASDAEINQAIKTLLIKISGK